LEKNFEDASKSLAIQNKRVSELEEIYKKNEALIESMKELIN
jgi:hypothetical protein